MAIEFGMVVEGSGAMHVKRPASVLAAYAVCMA